MNCPFCGKTAQATPEDRTDKNGRTFQVKVYKCISKGCGFDWMPKGEEEKYFLGDRAGK